MPNFDTGHYFLTTLAPIKSGSLSDETGEKISYSQNIRRILAVLPTALQSPATVRLGINSPFSRIPRTHLCRYMVMDDVIYNGRDKQNALMTAIAGAFGDKGSGGNPAVPNPVDNLSNGYLMFAADFDAVMKLGDPLPSHLSKNDQDKVRDQYARDLWHSMEDELRQIYENCYGFDQVKNADDFAHYISKIQVETTMPFNDYWLNAPAISPLPKLPIALLAGLPFLAFLFGVFAWLISCIGTWLGFGELVSWFTHQHPAAWTGWGLLGLIIGLFISYKIVMHHGQKPMPPGQYADLPNVLKSIYIQQKFADFAVQRQGMNADDLHRDFDAFCNEVNLNDKMSPTQSPGVISLTTPDHPQS